MPTLYNITERYQNLLDLCDGDNVNAELLDNALAHLDGELEDKVAGGIAVIQELKHRINSIDAEIKRLSKLKNAAENSIARIKLYYFNNLNSIGKSKVTTSRGSMAIIRAGGKRPLLIDNEELIPFYFKRLEINNVVDKDGIREALERGAEVTGAHLGERALLLKVN